MSEANEGWGTLREMLAVMASDFPSVHSLPRAWASELLESVGENIAWGNTTSSPREVAWALIRVFGSSRAEEIIAELGQGCREAAAFYADGSVPDDLR